MVIFIKYWRGKIVNFATGSTNIRSIFQLCFSQIITEHFDKHMKRFVSYILILSTLSVFAQQSKQLEFKEEIHDFGTVNEEGGPVTHDFVFTNNSSRPVKILTVQASCGCTTPGWSKDAVSPGKTGYVQASYNPKGRPGYFNKSLTVTTDFDASPIILQIKGQVSNEAVPSEADFPIVNGALKLKGSSFNMGKVFMKDEFLVKDFPIFNSGSKAITISNTVSPKYIRVEVDPKTINAGQKGVVRISYNGKMKNQYGFQSDNIELHTNDETNPVKSFSVYATLEDYFPDLTPEEAAKAPLLRLNAYALDFGKLRSKAVATRDIQFTNFGKKELSIRSVQGNCTCIKTQALKSSVKPGETSAIRIEFDPQDRSGTQQKAVTIYSNDPKNPVQRVTFTAYVD